MLPKKIVLIGNPNSGKTTLFNVWSGLHGKVANYAGVTVEKYSAHIKIDNTTIDLIDLPGLYSLYPRSIDENITVDELTSSETTIDGIILVADAQQRRRSLLLITQVLDLQIPCVIVWTMHDAKHFDIPIAFLNIQLSVPNYYVYYKKPLSLSFLLSQLSISTQTFVNPDLVEYKQFITNQKKQNQRVSKIIQDITYRWAWIDDILANIKQESSTSLKVVTISQKIDKIVTHHIYGFLILIAVLFGLFYALYGLADIPMQFLEWSSNKASVFFHLILGNAFWANLLIDGLWSGLFGIILFVPQIALLFGLIAILEESGYVARMSFMTDRIFRCFGLNGKSIVSLVGGWACAVPAMMAARNIAQPKVRLLTLFVTPLMTCSARLPVYTLLIGLMVSQTWKRSLILVFLYIFGLGMALIVSLFVSKILTLSKHNLLAKEELFLLELPPFRMPNVKNILISMFQKSWIFVRDAGKIIVIISLILWILSHIRCTDNFVFDYSSEIALSESILGKIGQWIEPILRPIGMDWKLGIAVLSSFAAREVFVGTLSTIYHLDTDNTMTLLNTLRLEKFANGQFVYSVATCWSVIIFYALALQCMSTVAVMYRETKSILWTSLQLFLYLFMAYFGSWLVYSIL